MHLVGSTLALLVAGAAAAPSMSAPMMDPHLAPKGKKVQWIGHSFHVFLPQPVERLAKEAGINDHQNLGFDMLPASVPCQHWNKGGSWKTVVQSGRADIMTLATREDIPDPCIPKFVKLAHASRPDMKVMVQETWLPFSPAIPSLGPVDPANKTLEKIYIDKPDKNIEKCSGIMGCSARNSATFETLERSKKEIEGPYRLRLRKQLSDLNKETGKNTSVLVPVWDATLTLRQAIVQGKVPGVAKQTDLFQDGLGHARPPLQNMVSYLWFAAIYGVDPRGMKSINSNAAQAKALQDIAWNALQKEPLNGQGR